MHLTSARLLADEVKAELEELAGSDDSLERMKRDGTFRNGIDTTDFRANINMQCATIVERHESLDPESYADDNSFRGLVAEILNMKSRAKEKWQLWLKDETQFAFMVQKLSLLESHRMWLGHLHKRIGASAPDSVERRLACLELLKSKGLAKAAAHGEPNAEGEDLIVVAGAEGWSAEDINALISAGADVSTADVNGKTGVWNASNCGHVSTLKALLSAGGNVNACTYDNEANEELIICNSSALYIAAKNGHADCVEALILGNADVLQCDKCVFGT